MEFVNGILNTVNVENKLISINNKIYTVNDKAMSFLKNKKLNEKVSVGIENDLVVFVKPDKKEFNKKENVVSSSKPEIDKRTLSIEIQSVFKELGQFVDLSKYDITKKEDCISLTELTVKLYHIRKNAELRVLGD